MRIPLQKLKAIILYFGEHTDQKFLGKVKLMKLFYFLDFTHVKKFGAPITFDRYFKLEHGPIPTVIKNLIDDAGEDVAHSALADTIDVECSPGQMIQRIVMRRKIGQEDLNLFSVSELETLQSVCSRFDTLNTREIEEASHKEAPWKESKLFEEIPYTLATHDTDCQVDEEDISLALRLNNYGK